MTLANPPLHKVDPVSEEVVELDARLDCACVITPRSPKHREARGRAYAGGDREEQIHRFDTDCDAAAARLKPEDLQPQLSPAKVAHMNNSVAAQPATFDATGDLGQAVSNAMAAAIHHAERVSRREHIKADRIERVSHFTTSLRRELGYVERTFKNCTGFRNLQSNLCHKRTWYDIGVLSTTTYIALSGFPQDLVPQWLAAARRLASTPQAAKDQIAGDLEELERGLGGCLSAVEEAQRINAESESVALRLCEMLE